jgi:magnesium transporter
VSVSTVLDAERGGLTWIDVVAPTREELEELAEQWHLHSTSVRDCLDPEHLPKFESFAENTFIIVRAYDEGSTPSCSTVQDLTRKVAIFFGPGFLITIHRVDQPFLAKLRERYSQPPAAGAKRRESLQPRLLADLFNGVINSYDRPLEVIENDIDTFEHELFNRTAKALLAQEIYLIKRRVTLMKRMLWHVLSVVQRLTPSSDRSAPFYQDVRENAEASHYWADELLDDVNNLLSVQLALASHRTNEVVRVLTVFSVFFLPLTFIVGIYGMNFRYMPELTHRWGYPGVLLGMALVTLAIYLWFRHRGWLRE